MRSVVYIFLGSLISFSSIWFFVIDERWRNLRQYLLNVYGNEKVAILIGIGKKLVLSTDLFGGLGINFKVRKHNLMSL